MEYTAAGGGISSSTARGCTYLPTVSFPFVDLGIQYAVVIRQFRYSLIHDAGRKEEKEKGGQVNIEQDPLYIRIIRQPNGCDRSDTSKDSVQATNTSPQI